MRLRGDTQRTGSLSSDTSPLILEVPSELYSPSTPMHTACLTSPLCSTSPSAPLMSLPNLESLGPPAFLQAMNPNRFPDPGSCQAWRGWATPQDGGRALLVQGPFVSCPGAQTGELLTSWVWRAAAPRRGLGEAAGFGPGWDIVAKPPRAQPPGRSSETV